MRLSHALPLIIVLAVSAPVSALAQDYAVRDSDKVMSQSELTTFLPARVIRFYDGGASEYYEDQRYTYTYSDGGTAYGYWQVESDGQICVRFVNGFARCDMIVFDGLRLALLTEDGDRFPIQPDSPMPVKP